MKKLCMKKLGLELLEARMMLSGEGIIEGSGVSDDVAAVLQSMSSRTVLSSRTNALSSRASPLGSRTTAPAP